VSKLLNRKDKLSSDAGDGSVVIDTNTYKIFNATTIFDKRYGIIKVQFDNAENVLLKLPTAAELINIVKVKKGEFKMDVLSIFNGENILAIETPTPDTFAGKQRVFMRDNPDQRIVELYCDFDLTDANPANHIAN
jgi:hypothetical protein